MGNDTEGVALKLRTGGFGGLCGHEAECGCGIEYLAPCGEVKAGCRPAYFGPEDSYYTAEAVCNIAADESHEYCQWARDLLNKHNPFAILEGDA